MGLWVLFLNISMPILHIWKGFDKVSGHFLRYTFINSVLIWSFFYTRNLLTFNIHKNWINLLFGFWKQLTWEERAPENIDLNLLITSCLTIIPQRKVFSILTLQVFVGVIIIVTRFSHPLCLHSKHISRKSVSCMHRFSSPLRCLTDKRTTQKIKETDIW